MMAYLYDKKMVYYKSRDEGLELYRKLELRKY